jgi:hypothetical protein
VAAPSLTPSRRQNTPADTVEVTDVEAVPQPA